MSFFKMLKREAEPEYGTYRVILHANGKYELQTRLSFFWGFESSTEDKAIADKWIKEVKESNGKRHFVVVAP